MNEKEIEILQEALASGTTIYWCPDGDTCEPVISVSLRHGYGTALCALFPHGFIPLSEAHLADFWEMRRLAAKEEA